ncbi:organelle RRM domain-containing protein 1, chloroplastic isoform X2 [Actinidia eriantha]|uniref:organelle RRM domain-containing protein 1, chloroplastic isoform X2 n=1 Tax=Actinidia eriantha TaxID=165200 RepID=UPI002585CB44|nr:organelle RRM domain-containing protein 1, chloroplastic isoform X2 [Actinidia eriantha]
MEAALSPSPTVITFNKNPKFSIRPPKSPLQYYNFFPKTIKLKCKKKNTDNLLALSSSSSSLSSVFNVSSSTRTSAASTTSTPSTFATSSSTTSGHNHHWMVVMETPPRGINSRPQIIDYYVKTLQSVLGSEKDAQMCIYDASWKTHFGFCCDVDEETSHELAQKDYSISEVQLGPLSNTLSGSTLLFPAGNSKHWLVRMDKPAIGVSTKAGMVDYCTQLLTKVMGNEKDAQMCIYHISSQSNYGFCCELDEECARELDGIPGVLSVQLDENFESDNKDYGGESLQQFGDLTDSSAAIETTNVKTKKLFVAGLSFYTSEKTLRAAFEGFGELVEVKIIIDKISKRSKGFAFVEYTTEEAAGAALREMTGKIINGWMITVDVAKTNPPKYSRGRPARLSD